MKKIIEINPYMLGTMAGGAADCQFWHRNLGVKVIGHYPITFRVTTQLVCAQSDIYSSLFNQLFLAKMIFWIFPLWLADHNILHDLVPPT